MANIEEIIRAVNFIENHLTEPITIKNAADAAGYSLYHFSRTFNHLVGHSPYDYLMRRRLSEAVKTLISSKKRVIDVAFEFQFNNPETFSRAFRKMFGLLPQQIKKGGNIREQDLKSKTTLAYLKHINQGGYLTPQITILEKLLLVGLATELKPELSGIVRLQEQFENLLGAIRNRIETSTIYGISTYDPKCEHSGTFYMTGVRVHSLDQAPVQLVAKQIPAFKYVAFIHRGSLSDLVLTLDFIYQTWLPKTGIRPASAFELMIFNANGKSLVEPTPEFKLLIPIAKTQ